MIENVEISPNTNLHENDLFYANVTVSNQGTETSGSILLTLILKEVN